jgi:hypothetical protein
VTAPTRNFPDWIKAYMEYASYSEAPPKMHFWTAVSSVAGALRRRVWIDQGYFQWIPNFYVVFVAPPGIVAKTTTADIGMDILRMVPGIKFGPSVVTWQSLVKSFAEAAEMFELGGEMHTMAAMTISSGEFGNLLNPQDREMVDMLVSLWDGKGFKKETKFSGSDTVVNPWINLIACTTPAWIAGNFPEYMIGGGFTSRVIWVYTDKKYKLVPYPAEAIPPGHDDFKLRLAQDLEQISQMGGAYQLSRDAKEWGAIWYNEHFTKRQAHLEDDRYGGYIARKQTHIHKLAMVLAASRTSRMVIELDDLVTAAQLVTDLEAEMIKVFGRIGLNEVSLGSHRLIEWMKKRGEVKYEEAYRYIHSQFPNFKEYEDMLKGLIQSRHLLWIQDGKNVTLRYNYQKGEIRQDGSVQE